MSNAYARDRDNRFKLRSSNFFKERGSNDFIQMYKSVPLSLYAGNRYQFEIILLREFMREKLIIVLYCVLQIVV